jgi:hypothetical protein
MNDVRCLFVARKFVVCSTNSTTMADCYVPLIRVRSLFVLVRSSFVRSFAVRLSLVCSSFVRPPHPPWLIVMYPSSAFVRCSFSFVRCLFSFVVRLSFIRSSFVRPPHPPWLIVMYHSSAFVRCSFSFVRRLFVCRSCSFVCSFVIFSTTSPAMADCYVPLIRVCSLFVIVRLLFVLVRCSFVVHSFVVCLTTSPAMADCYVPLIRVRSLFVLVCSSFVVRSSFVCHSFVCHLFDHLTRHG